MHAEVILHLRPFQEMPNDRAGMFKVSDLVDRFGVHQCVPFRSPDEHGFLRHQDIPIPVNLVAIGEGKEKRIAHTPDKDRGTVDVPSVASGVLHERDGTVTLASEEHHKAIGEAFVEIADGVGDRHTIVLFKDYKGKGTIDA